MRNILLLMVVMVLTLSGCAVSPETEEGGEFNQLQATPLGYAQGDDALPNKQWVVDFSQSGGRVHSVFYLHTRFESYVITAKAMDAQGKVQHLVVKPGAWERDVGEFCILSPSNKQESAFLPERVTLFLVNKASLGEKREDAIKNKDVSREVYQYHPLTREWVHLP